MEPSTELCEFTKKSEGLRLEAYPDNGAYSIGYGHHGVAKGTVWTEAQADAAFEVDMDACAQVVGRMVKVPLSQGQFDCLCDFVYNEGAENLWSSSLLSILNLGNYARVPQELYRIDPVTGEQHGWIMVKGKVNAGLIARRKGEIEFWEGLTPDTHQA